jgi:hypothetical protein
MLIMKASSDINVCETNLIERVAELYDIEVDVHEIKTATDLNFAEYPADGWDLVYACGHGNEIGIGDPDGSRFFHWDQVAMGLCDRLGLDAWFFLGCCRGGLQRVAYSMFCGCDNLYYVFGPRWEADAQQLACAFHVLVHNFIDRGREPVRAAERASEGIDLTIRAFDRGEVESTDAFLAWCATNGYEAPFLREDATP